MFLSLTRGCFQSFWINPVTCRLTETPDETVDLTSPCYQHLKPQFAKSLKQEHLNIRSGTGQPWNCIPLYFCRQSAERQNELYNLCVILPGFMVLTSGLFISVLTCTDLGEDNVTWGKEDKTTLYKRGKAGEFERCGDKREQTKQLDGRDKNWAAILYSFFSPFWLDTRYNA